MEPNAPAPLFLPAMPPRWRRWMVLGVPSALLLMTVQLWLSGRFEWHAALLLAATDIVPWLLALPLVIRLANRFPIEGARRGRHAALHLGAAVVVSWLMPLAVLGALRGLHLDPMAPPRPAPAEQRPAFPAPPPPVPREPAARPLGPRRPPAVWRMAAMRMPFHWVLYALVLTILHGWRVQQHSRARERRATELERLLAEARLTGLSRQLHPHFLFNTLNTIVEFVRSDPMRAEEMLIDVSELLRQGLRAADRHVVPLAEELDLLDRYLEIQRARFGERLHVERRIAPQSLAASVPVLMLQPLVENAVRHGLDRSDAVVTVAIDAALQGDRLRLTVSDDAPPAANDTGGEGIGLANTRQRLVALYGEDFHFHAGPRQGGGFSVDFVLPFHPGSVKAGQL